MREILFRGKRDKRYCEAQDWTYGVPFIDHEGDCIFKTNASEFVVDPETVGQYTGFTDKNGKKIFEGDYWIDTDEGDIFVVEFRNGQFCFVIYGVSGSLMEYGWDCWGNEVEEREVV